MLWASKGGQQQWSRRTVVAPKTSSSFVRTNLVTQEKEVHDKQLWKNSGGDPHEKCGLVRDSHRRGGGGGRISIRSIISMKRCHRESMKACFQPPVALLLLSRFCFRWDGNIPSKVANSGKWFFHSRSAQISDSGDLTLKVRCRNSKRILRYNEYQV